MPHSPFSPTWDDDEGNTSYTPHEWDDVKPFVEELFVEIDRPNDWLLRLTIEVRGDESGGEECAFADGLTAEQQDRLLRHAAKELLRFAETRNRHPRTPSTDST